jgi:hypothetical protein
MNTRFLDNFFQGEYLTLAQEVIPTVKSNRKWVLITNLKRLREDISKEEDYIMNKTGEKPPI